MTPGRHEQLPDLGGQHPGLIPPGGHQLDEIESGLSFISGRVIRDHGRRIIEADIHGELMTARAEDIRGDVMGFELSAGHGAEAAEMIIHGPGDQPREGHVQIVLRRTAGAPFEVLQVQRAFVVHQIGISALPAGWFPDSMQMDQDMMPRRRLEHGLGELDGFLVVMIEEIHHQAAPAQLLEGGESLFHPPAQGGLMHPSPQPHVLRGGVAANRRQVEIRARPRHIGVRSRFHSWFGLIVPGRGGSLRRGE